MYEQDWIMRQIQMIVSIIAMAVLKKEVAAYHIADSDNLTRIDYLYKDLETLLARREVCEAEDLLFEQLDGSNPEYLVLALDFYQKLNALDDEELEGANFSREEIASGLNDVTKAFGLPPFVV